MNTSLLKVITKDLTIKSVGDQFYLIRTMQGESFSISSGPISFVLLAKHRLIKIRMADLNLIARDQIASPYKKVTPLQHNVISK